MNWKNVLLIGAVALLPISTMAQANILNAKRPEEIGKKTESQIEKDNDAPLDYGYVDDRDILWSKTVWEVIDLDERVNFPLYYPIDTVD
ncbi:MAG: gliding motility protein GldN, partial [Cellulophaga baltica]